MDNIIPDPDEARQLRAEYAGHPIIDRAEADLRQFDVAGAQAADQALLLWANYDELSPRERRAILARFVPDIVPDPASDAAGNSGPGWPFGGAK